TYSPPVPFASRDSIIGTQVPGSGSATGVQGSTTFTLNYTSASTPLAIETVTVPAGTFTNAVHVRLTINYSGVVNYSVTLDDWLVAGVGSVREVSTDTNSTTTTTWELRSYAIRRPLADFSGDGHSDVLWRNTSTGENYIYLMNGLTIASQGSINAVSDQAWQVKGIGDFDGDGHDSILSRTLSPRDDHPILLEVSTNTTRASATTWELRSDGQLRGIGDFGGDGNADVLWRNTSTGENYIWLMNGLTIARPGSINSLSDQAWQVQGIGDYDGDGRADLLWRNSSTGENYIWLMNGLSTASQGSVNFVDPA